ncbi:MAG: cell division protein FtsQ [Bacteroidaceae bacterium]|nr:cell division protein FtsQ [Bacteroidaceae bacterium]
MKLSKILKFTVLSLLSLGLMTYIVYAMFFLSGPDEEERCTAVELTVEKDNGSSMFVDAGDIEKILKNANVYPKGMLMKDVDTEKIEETIRGNEFISKVECYKSSNGKLCVNVEQRVPVVFVIPDGKDGYFVDAQGKIIPNRNSATNLVVASGNIDEKYASKELAEFGQFLQTDEFWNNQIEQIYVTKDRKGKRVVEIVPRVGDQIVYLGTLENYQKKLRKLRTFYDKAVGTVGWEKYARVNLEYDNQIICTKRK